MFLALDDSILKQSHKFHMDQLTANQPMGQLKLSRSKESEMEFYKIFFESFQEITRKKDVTISEKVVLRNNIIKKVNQF